MKHIREPQVAGMFYPSNSNELKNQVNKYLESITFEENVNHVGGIISPHAGYIYSGKTAAYAYKAIINKTFKNVVVISPSHREYFTGVSIFNGDAYRTPLGEIPINKELRKSLISQSDLLFSGIEGHRAEHALEVQLPFLQCVLEDIELIPMVIGDQSREIVFELAEILARFVDEDTLIVASSDLSHFYSKSHANSIDSRIVNYIDKFEFDQLQNDLEVKNCEACGGGGIVALLKALKMNGYLKSKVLSHTDSSDVTGDESEVVGYLSAIIFN